MYGQPMYGQPMQPMQPMYGQPPMQPMYNQPVYMPPPPVQQGPTIITISGNNNNGTPCQFCGTNTHNVTRKKVGCVAILWGLLLLWLTGFLCCLPCCMDQCKDTELVCSKCQQIKTIIPAQCCWFAYSSLSFVLRSLNISYYFMSN